MFETSYIAIFKPIMQKINANGTNAHQQKSLRGLQEQQQQYSVWCRPLNRYRHWECMSSHWKTKKPWRMLWVPSAGKANARGPPEAVAGVLPMLKPQEKIKQLEHKLHSSTHRGNKLNKIDD